ncbi:ABC transporter substrate-binding protein [Nonomuraea fastidiosa]|jgi:branched-chain amino acid transport system substrate-binding protein|uniref:ABC transporter substrate-binding protein n=1 Tax=Nonomuraea TaxID=83681 RepID=UPI0032465F2F
MRLPMLGLPAAGLAVLMAAGCGGAVPQAGDAAPVEVGAIITQTGVYAALGDEMETAMRLYLDDHGGRLGGRPARLIVADDAGSPERARKEARRLIGEGADVLTGLISSPVAVAVADEAGRGARGRAVLGPGGGEGADGAGAVPVVVANAGADELGGPHVFRVSYTNREHGRAAGRYAAERYGRRPVALMASGYSAGEETLRGFVEGYGAEPIARVMTPPGTVTEFERYLARVPDEAELLFACYAGGEAVAFARAYKRLGYDAKVPLLASMNLTDEDVLRAIGPDAEGITSVGMYAPALDNPDNAAFVARWRARTGRDPSAVALQGWDAMRVIDAALSRGGDLTRRLGELGELAGPRGPFRLDERHEPVQNWYAREYHNGVNSVTATIPP